MTVYFIGAGPGASDLITVRGRDLIARADLVLYAGSLVPAAMLDWAPADCPRIDSAPLTLDRIIETLAAHHRDGAVLARLHSGDPSLYGAIGEQMRRLDRLDLPYEVVPGVPAFAAAAALLKRELTLPGVSQTVILTRTAMKSSPMPEGEDLARLAASGASLAIHLSVRNLGPICKALIPVYGADAPIVVVYRASWPDQQIVRGTLATIRDSVRAAKITRTALILVGPVLRDPDFADSALYDAAHRHLLRPG